MLPPHRYSAQILWYSDDTTQHTHNWNEQARVILQNSFKFLSEKIIPPDSHAYQELKYFHTLCDCTSIYQIVSYLTQC